MGTDEAPPTTVDAVSGDPLDSLRALVAAVEAAEGRASRLRALSDHRPPGEDFELLASRIIDDPGAVESVLDRLRAIEGMATAADRMAADLRRRGAVIAKAARAGLRLASPDDAGPDLDLTEVVPGAVVPAGYLLVPDGVFRLVPGVDGGVRAVRLSYAPIIVTRRLFGLDGGAHVVEVSWFTRGAWRRALVPRSVVADGRALVSLADQGAPVLGELARGLSTFLGAWEAVNIETIPRSYTSERLGWMRGGGFLLGRELVGRAPGAVVFDADDGYGQLADAIAVGGTWEGWLGVLGLVSRYPLAYAAVYAAACAPLLAIAKCPNFLVDWSSRSGRGKSTGTELGMSGWGQTWGDHSLIGAWKSTSTGIERRAVLFCDLPILLDETNAVPDAQRPELAANVYMVANGVGKTRGTVSGLQRTTTWRTVGLSTGEARLTEYTQDEGTRARVISLVGYVLDKHGAELSEAIRAGIRQHYGHLGRRLIAYLVVADHEEIRRAYNTHLAAMSIHTAEASAMGRRLATYVALMATVADIMHAELGVPRPEVDPIAEVWRQAQAGSADADRAADALRTVWEAAFSRQASFWGRHEGTGDHPREPHGGWVGGWDDGHWTEIAFIGRALRGMLEGAGHRPDAILAEWKARGWLRLSSGRSTVSVDAGPGPRVRCYVVLRSALVEIEAVDP